jgi:hypothetical protein
MITIAAGPDDLVSARMPTLAERRALGILAPDVPVLSLKRPGQAEELFDARLVEIVASGPLHDEPERPMNDQTITRPKPCEEHPQGATWFDRELCAPPCGMMHTRCRACGYPSPACQKSKARCRQQVVTGHSGPCHQPALLRLGLALLRELDA